MKRSRAFCLIVAVLALAGCGSGAKQATTIAGVGVKTTGPPPGPSKPTACTDRWNAGANAGGRAAAKHQAPDADAALVRTAGTSGYFREEAGRCLIYLVTPSKSAVVFVEAAPGRFVFTADASGRFATNADLRESERLHLR